MEIELLRPVTVHVDALRIVVEVTDDDIDEECCPADMPGLKNGKLTLVIDLDTKRVRDWPAGRAVSLHLHPRDEGRYYLLSRDTVILSREESPVPDFLPGEHFGDYLILNIGADGTVLRWDFDADEVQDSFEMASN